MSVLLFGRAVRLIVGTLLVEGLRVSFSIKKGKSKEPNDCKLSIYNLNESSRASLQGKGQLVAIQAGYKDNMGSIFSGKTLYTSHEHRGADWVTVLQLSEGLEIYKYIKVYDSFKSGTRVADVFTQIANKTGLDAKEAIATVQSKITEQFTKGYAAAGTVGTELDKLLKGRNLEWFIRDGKLVVLPKNTPTTEDRVLLTSDSGLIGSPNYGSPAKKGEKQTLKVKSLLLPTANPGRKLELQSRAIKGNFLIHKVTHTGDTHGGEWYSEMECYAIS